MELKKILIVGAGSGIGKALFDKFVKDSNLLVIGISRRGIPYSNEFHFSKNYSCNLLNQTEVENFFNFYSKFNKTLDAIYFCQGDGLFSKVENITIDSLNQHLALNLTSNFLLIKLFSNLIKSTANSFVCFLSSTAGKVGFKESTAYSASKHAIAGFAKSLREEWKEFKVRVFLIYPGAISTEIWNNRDEFNTNDMIKPEEFAEYLASFIYLPSTINVEDSYILPIKGIL